MRHAHAALLAAAALLAGCGQPLLSMQLDVPEIRITSPARSFPATDVPLDVSVLCDALRLDCAVITAEYDIGSQVPVLDENGVDFDLRLTNVALDLVPGAVADLRNVLAVVVRVEDPASGDLVAVASYAKPPGATPTQISVSGNSNLPLAPYLSAGKLRMRIELSLDLGAPQPAFSASIEAGFSLVVTVSYDAFL